MFDHVGVTVSDLERARRFYAAALGPLGITALMEFEGVVAFGRDRPQFWISAGGPGQRSRMHVAFEAATRMEVEAFHRAALDAGGTDNGPPGVREQYHPQYYGAFVLDPDGSNVEAVCHRCE